MSQKNVTENKIKYIKAPLLSLFTIILNYMINQKKKRLIK